MTFKKETEGGTWCSMACSPDISTGSIGIMHDVKREGIKVAIVAEVNEILPLMCGMP